MILEIQSDDKSPLDQIAWCLEPVNHRLHVQYYIQVGHKAEQLPKATNNHTCPLPFAEISF